MEDPVFTAELDVSHGSSYGGFISGVRNQLVLHAGATCHLELVLLRRQEEDPRKAPWFGVTLRCGSSGDSVLLRIRADNLYISGYQSPAGRWWEFRGGSVIDTATQLAFTDNYESMGKAAKLALERVTLSKKDLEAAVGAARGSGSQRRRQSAGYREIAYGHRGDGLRSHQVQERRRRTCAHHVQRRAVRPAAVAHGQAGEELGEHVRVLARRRPLRAAFPAAYRGRLQPTAVRAHPSASARTGEDRLPGPRHDGARRVAEPAGATARQAQAGARRALARRAGPSTQA